MTLNFFDPTVLAPLIVFSILAGWINAAAGIAGGIILFAILNLFFAPVDAIAIHGLAGVFSNSLRWFLYRRFIHWKLFFLYVSLILPGALLGIQLIDYFEKESLRVTIGTLILLFAVSPKISAGSKKLPEYILIPVGLVSAFCSMIVGIIGPFVAPFLLALGLEKEAFIGTKSLCQLSVQTVKVILCLHILDFNFMPHTALILSIFFGITIGSLLGKRTLQKMTSKRFHSLVRALLAVLGAHILLTR